MRRPISSFVSVVISSVLVGGAACSPSRPTDLDFTATIASSGVSNGAVLLGAPVAFSAQTVSGAVYTWNFGDGSTASGQSVSHTFTAATSVSGATSPASLTVTLTVTSGSQSATATLPVAVFALNGCWLDASNGPTTSGGFRYDGHNLVQTGTNVTGHFLRTPGDASFDDFALQGTVTGSAPENIVINGTRAANAANGNVTFTRTWTLQIQFNNPPELVGHEIDDGVSTAIRLRFTSPAPNPCGGHM